MRNFITGRDIELARAMGKAQIEIGPADVVTGVAREQADKLGIRIVVGREPAPAAGPSGRTAAGGDRAPGYDLKAWRRKFPILREKIHAANCSQAPQSDFTREAAQAYLESWDSMGMDWERWMEEVHLAKAEFAAIIGAEPSEIALATSVSEATAAVASALSFQGRRRKVVATEAEFPTIGHVWLAQRKFGAEVVFIPVKDGEIDPQDYDRHVDASTLITSICDVYYYNGFKQDLSAIVPRIHAHGSLVYLDAYQGLGTHPIDVKALDIDFLASGNLKYLLGVPGVAFLYVKKELIPHLEPAFTGWFGRQNPFAFQVRNLDWAADARRFDTGTPPVMAAYIARAGMHIVNTVGVANIQQWTDRLSRVCIDQARARGLEVASPLSIAKKSPTTAIRIPGGDSHAVEAALRDRHIIVSARSDVIRIAPHFFTREEDILAILDALTAVIRP
jgi:selenocysteine lyase/cysteine desulfurase